MLDCKRCRRLPPVNGIGGAGGDAGPGGNGGGDGGGGSGAIRIGTVVVVHVVVDAWVRGNVERHAEVVVEGVWAAKVDDNFASPYLARLQHWTCHPGGHMVSIQVQHVVKEVDGHVAAVLLIVPHLDASVGGGAVRLDVLWPDAEPCDPAAVSGDVDVVGIHTMLFCAPRYFDPANNSSDRGIDIWLAAAGDSRGLEAAVS
eukprot:scaffold647902_cov48-Prasinocladus_malaysianus.AAC.2